MFLRNHKEESKNNIGDCRIYDKREINLIPFSGLCYFILKIFARSKRFYGSIQCNKPLEL